MTILTNFNEIGSQDGQDAHLVALISASATKRRRPNAENHSYEQNNQYPYKVNCGDLENVMCHEAFASLRGIGTKRVRRVAMCGTEGHTPKDKRGMHNNKLTDTHNRGAGGESLYDD